MRPELYSYADGSISKEPPTIPFLDHGFLFGDSLYEVVRMYDRKIFGWKEHCERMIESGKLTGFNIQDLLPEIEKRAHALFKEMKHSDAVVRVVVTRGVGELHINPEYCKEPSIYLASWQFVPELTPKSIKVAVTSIRRNYIHSIDPAIKSGNYLNNVMAFKAADRLGYDDAILLNPDNQISELTTSNIAWIKNDKLRTPDVRCGILHGITRKLLLSHEDFEQGFYPETELVEAEEVFALSTFKEVLPISEIRFEDGVVKKYSTEGKVLSLQKKFKEIIAAELKSVDPVF